jgi:hypothetical protein
MSRLTKIIAPILQAHRLDVHQIEGVKGEIRELVDTNPSFPHWGRIIIDRDGLLEWDHWGDLDHDDGANALARVIISILASGDQPDPGRYGKSTPQSSEALRPHP